MRGLKPLVVAFLQLLRVASFTDAWIETKKIDSDPDHKKSHLLQMRGLKLINPEARKKALESHLLQMRGLKLLELVDAKSAPCRIFYRCVD